MSIDIDEARDEYRSVVVMVRTAYVTDLTQRSILTDTDSNTNQ